MQLSTLERTLWLVSTICNATVLVVILIKKRSRVLPLFTAFTACGLFRTAVVYVAYRIGSKAEYFALYWSLSALVDVFLQAGVIYEIASGVFRPTGRRWAPDVRGKLLLVSVSGFLIGAGLTALATGSAPTSVETFVMKGSFFGAVLMAELTVGMLLLSGTVGLPWKGHLAVIAKGFGWYSLLIVLLETAHNIFGKAYTSSADIALFNLEVFAYICCQCYWIMGLWREVPKPACSADEAHRAAAFWTDLIHSASRGEQQ